MHASTSGCPIDKVLLDSDILIDHLRGYEPARQYLKRFEAGEVQGYLSIIFHVDEEKVKDCNRFGFSGTTG